MTSTADSPLGKYGLSIHATKIAGRYRSMGAWWWHSRFTNFAGGTEDGQHVISININVLGAEKHIKNILVSEFAGKTKQVVTIKKSQVS